jgi:hypothetical protein
MDEQYIYVAYDYKTIDGVDSLRIGMMSTDEKEVVTFAEKHEMLVTRIENGEEWPSI